VKLPRNLSGAALVKALNKLGYQIVRQQGSHIRLTTEEDGQFHITVPNHNPMRVGTLGAILKKIAEHHQITLEELIRKLEL
jgi:predicted RNA binding protein YcfA (HicA-like mRNA interferase family)